MRSFFSYLGAQLKRILKIYPVVLAFSLVLAAIVGAFIVTMLTEENDDTASIKVRIGIVGEIEETRLGIGISAFQEFDTSRFYVEFVEFENDEQAVAQLKNNEILGYIKVPDGFVDSIIHGENMHLQYISGHSPTAVIPLMTKEILSLLSNLVMESQNGIYALDDLAEKYGASYISLSDGMDELNMSYFDSMFSREEAYEIENINATKGLPFDAYYPCAFFLLLILLCGLICAPILVKQDMALPRVLCFSGRGVLPQVWGDYIPFLLIGVANVTLFTLGMKLLPQNIAFVDTIAFAHQPLMLMVALIPCAILLTSMQFLLYELSVNIISGVLIQLLTTVALSYISGFFYPSGALPEAVQAVASYTPTGLCFDYMADMFSGAPSVSAVMAILGYSLLFIAASVLVRSLKIRSVSA